MDKVLKFLKRLSQKESEAIEALIEQIILDYTRVPGKRPIRSKTDWYKVRIGERRLVFSIVDKQKKEVRIERVGNRDERTYKNL
jgi:mRNA-degrading endonuclease RelE of RelBE toxin-antitoxin system